MSFEISCQLRLRFRLVWLGLVHLGLLRALGSISGGMDGRLSPFDGLLRAPYGANNVRRRMLMLIKVKL